VDALIASFALAVIRFAMIGWGIASPSTLLAAQVLHAATFGACHLASVALVNQWFTDARQVRGQALYLSLAFGLGGFVGAAASGVAWEAIGPAWTYTGASALAAAGLLLVLRNARLLREVSGSTPAPARAL
jgi:PPP family 3-phenylpropionic acid transporter